MGKGWGEEYKYVHLFSTITKNILKTRMKFNQSKLNIIFKNLNSHPFLKSAKIAAITVHFTLVDNEVTIRVKSFSKINAVKNRIKIQSS